MKNIISSSLLVILSFLFIGSLIPWISADEWKVRDHRGAPCLFRNGKPITPLVFWEWEPTQYGITEFSKADFQLFSFFGSFPHYDNPYWREDGSFGMDYQDRFIDLLHQWNPKACYLPRIFVTAPNWWGVKNPKEVVQFANPPKNKKRPVRESFASEKAKKDVGEHIRKAIRHLLDAPTGNQMFGIHVTNGPWGENFNWDAFLRINERKISPASDTSEPMTRAFRQYLREKYNNDVSALRKAFRDPQLSFDTVSVPSYQERTTFDKGAWRDPGRSRLVPDYFECHHKTTVDMLDYYCKIVKEESKGNLTTLVFYGYTQDENWPLECDHRAISDLYQRESIDMMSAPHTYYRRGLGEDGQMRHYLASAALHGKLFFDEGDDMTHLEMLKKNPDHRCYARTREHSKAFLYREFGNMVTNGTGLWYMDLKKGGFNDPELIDLVGRMKKWADESLNHSRKRCSKVAVISAPQSEFYLGYRQNPENEISYGLYHDQMGHFFRAGAPFDWYLIDDLDAVEKGDYQVCLFLDCFYLTDSHIEKIDRLKSRNRTLVWFYAPGYVSENALSQKRMEDLTGFRFQQHESGKLAARIVSQEEKSNVTIGIDKIQKSFFTVLPDDKTKILANGIEKFAKDPVIASKQFENWRSIYSAIPGLNRTLLLDIYRSAKIPLYIESDDILSANESWLMIHTRSAGKKRVSLPFRYRKITEVTGENFIRENTDHFEIDLPQYTTVVFLLEK